MMRNLYACGWPTFMWLMQLSITSVWRPKTLNSMLHEWLPLHSYLTIHMTLCVEVSCLTADCQTFNMIMDQVDCVFMKVILGTVPTNVTLECWCVLQLFYVYMYSICVYFIYCSAFVFRSMSDPNKTQSCLVMPLFYFLGGNHIL